MHMIFQSPVEWLRARCCLPRCCRIGEPGRVPAGLEKMRTARELVISHVEHIYTKIGASNRVQASLFAVKHGLMSEWSAAGLERPPD